ncbi:MAG: sulfotransferase [Psychroserpens sp.]|uniref:sulfotransferase family protein n=1 Tax=Psychroserpens sp. TaxID=2020870 RepID=UPI003002C839
MNIGQFFILGNPRSGTSLLRLILNCHSKLTVPPECGFLLWLESKYRDWSEKDLTSNRLNTFIQDLQLSKKFETWHLDNNAILKEIKKQNPKTYQKLAQCVYLSYAVQNEKQPAFLGDKNNYYVNHLDELDQLFSEKFIIHIVRDGRDVAVSYKKLKNIADTIKYKPKLPTSIEDIAEEWQRNTLKIHEHYKNSQFYTLIRYEDLLLRPIEVLSNVLLKFNLQFEPEMLEYYAQNSDYMKEPAETLAWKKKTMEPLDINLIGSFKSQLTNAEISSFNTRAEVALKTFEYAS